MDNIEIEVGQIVEHARKGYWRCRVDRILGDQIDMTVLSPARLRGHRVEAQPGDELRPEGWLDVQHTISMVPSLIARNEGSVTAQSIQNDIDVYLNHGLGEQHLGYSVYVSKLLVESALALMESMGLIESGQDDQEYNENPERLYWRSEEEPEAWAEKARNWMEGVREGVDRVPEKWAEFEPRLAYIEQQAAKIKQIGWPAAARLVGLALEAEYQFGGF